MSLPFIDLCHHVSQIRNNEEGRRFPCEEHDALRSVNGADNWPDAAKITWRVAQDRPKLSPANGYAQILSTVTGL